MLAQGISDGRGGLRSLLLSAADCRRTVRRLKSSGVHEECDLEGGGSCGTREQGASPRGSGKRDLKRS